MKHVLLVALLSTFGATSIQAQTVGLPGISESSEEFLEQVSRDGGKGKKVGKAASTSKKEQLKKKKEQRQEERRKKKEEHKKKKKGNMHSRT